MPLVDARCIGEVSRLLGHELRKFAVVPVKRRDAFVPRTDLHAQMLSLRSDGSRRTWAEIPHAENRAWVAHPVRFEQGDLLHHRERPIRRSNQRLNRDFRRVVLNLQLRIYIIRECTAKVLHAIAFKRQSCRHRMTAELDERIPARGERIVHMKPRDAAARALVDIALPRQHNARTVVFLDQTRGDNADHARIPVPTGDHNRRHIGCKAPEH